MAARGMTRDVLLQIISRFEDKGAQDAKKAILDLSKLDKKTFLGGLGGIFKGMASNVLGLLNPLKMVQGLLGTVGGAVRHLGDVFKIGLGVVAGTAINTALGALRELATSPVEIAARVGVLEVVFYRLGQQAGYTKDKLVGYVDALKDTGITTRQSLENLTKMIQANLDLSKATDLARTAQDAAVIADVNSSEAFSRLIHGITTLQPEILRGLGIIVDIQGEVKRWAAAHDVAVEAVSASTKQQIAFDAVLQAGQRIAGAYEEAMTEVGKKMTSLPRYIEEAKLALGRGLKPVLSATVDILGDVLKKAEAFFEEIEPTLTAFSERVGTGLKSLYEKAQSAVGALVEGFNYVRPYLQEVGEIIGHYLPYVASRLRFLWLALKEALISLAGAIATHVPNMANIWTFFTDTLKATFDSLLKILTGLRQLLIGEGEQAARSFSEAMANGLAVLIIIWEDYASKALTWGYNLVAEFANGMISAASQWITAAIDYVGSLIASFLASFSPPKKGVLRGIVEWGKGLINEYFKGFTKADFGILDRVGGMIQSALQSAVSLGDLPEEEMIPLFRTVRTQLAGLISDFRKTGEISEEALGTIADTLGEGSEDLVKYLRLQLEHQKALKDLSAIQEEYAAAEAAGFVPAELKERLRKAQEAADAKEEELSWQEALVKAQQDGIDLQVQQVRVLQQLAKALEGMTGAMGKMRAPKVPKAKVAAPEAPALPEAPAFAPVALPEVDTSKLKEDIKAGIDKAFKGVSKRFAEAKEKGRELIAKFIAGAREKLADLPGTIREGLGAAFEILREKLPWIDNLIAKFDQLKSWGDANWPTMLATVLTVWTVMAKSIGVVVDMLVGYVWPKLQEAFANLNEALTTLGLDWSDVWDAIKKATGVVAVVIGAIILGLIAAITGITTAIASVAVHVTAVLSDIASTFMQGLESISKMIGGAMAIIRGIFSGDLDLIAAGWRAWVDGLWGLIKTFFNGAINFFKLSFGTLLTAVWGFVEGFIAFFIVLYDRLVGGSIIPDLVNGVLAWFQSLYDDTLGKVASFVADVLAKFEELRDKANRIAGQIRDWVAEKIGGIADSFIRVRTAIDDAIGKLSEFLTNLASAVIPEWLKPGSATPFEIGLWGILNAMSQLSGVAQGFFVFRQMRADLEALVGEGGVIPLFVTKTVTWFTELKTKVIRLVTEMSTWVIQLLMNLRTRAVQIVLSLVTKAIQLFTEMVTKVKQLIADMVQSVLESLIELRDGAEEILIEITQIFERMGRRMADAIDEIATQINRLLKKLDKLIEKAQEASEAMEEAGLLPSSPPSLVVGLTGINREMARLHQQIGFTTRDFGRLATAGLTLQYPTMVPAAAPAADRGGNTYQFFFGEGAFAGAFPSVRTARDERDITETFQQMIETAAAKASVPGGTT